MCLRICQINSLVDSLPTENTVLLATIFADCYYGAKRILSFATTGFVVLIEYTHLSREQWLPTPDKPIHTTFNATNVTMWCMHGCLLTPIPNSDDLWESFNHRRLTNSRSCFTTSSNPDRRILNTREAMEGNVNYQVKTSRNYYVSTHT